MRTQASLVTPCEPLAGVRWTIALRHRHVWLIVEVASHGPRGVRLARDGERPCRFHVGDFYIFPSITGDRVFTVRADAFDGEPYDRDLVRAWIAAGAPESWTPGALLGPRSAT